MTNQDLLSTEIFFPKSKYEKEIVDTSIANEFIGLPFWCNTSGSDNCCFNHKIGLPQKNGITHPIYDYEIDFKEKIEQYQHIWVKKARGIGATTFLIRYLAWKALSTNELENRDIFIIAGTREDFGNEIKVRIEQLFPEQYRSVVHDSKYTLTYINKTRFKVFPSKNLKDMRGYTDVSYLFIDEADYFEPREQAQIKYVIKSYEEKSKGKIIMVSTAGESGGLFESIENDPNSDFYKHYMLVDKGKGKIFDDVFLEDQKTRDPAFYKREYEGQYGYGLGNVFLPYEIEDAIVQLTDEQALKDEEGKILGYKVNPSCEISMGIDPGFGSSKFGITILMLEDNIFKVCYAKEWDRPSYENMVSLVARLHYTYKPRKIYVDAAKPDFIKSLKVELNETTNFEKVMEDAKREKVDYEHRMKVCPIAFNEHGKELLGRFQHVVSKKWFSIPNSCTQLITQMRMAKFKDNGNLDKEDTTSNNTYDVFDSTRLALRMFEKGAKH